MIDAPAGRKWASPGGRGRGSRCHRGSWCARIDGGGGRRRRHLGRYREEERAFLAATGERRSANHDSSKAMPENKSVKAA